MIVCRREYVFERLEILEEPRNISSLMTLDHGNRSLPVTVAFKNRTEHYQGTVLVMIRKTMNSSEKTAIGVCWASHLVYAFRVEEPIQYDKPPDKCPQGIPRVGEE